jgi:hypothetical protein
VTIFTAFSAGERVVGTTNMFYQGDRDKSIRKAIETRLALPELAPNPEKWAQTWSFPRNQKLTVNLALLDTIRRMRSLLPVGASQVDPGAAAAEQQQDLDDIAYLQQQNDMLAAAQEEERKKKLLVKGATWSIGGIALLVGGIVVYKLLTGKKAVAALPPAPMPAALPATAKNPWHGPMFPYRGLPESDIPGADVEIDYDVASRMLDWHGGQGDPIYAAGSSALAGMPVPANVAQSAVCELSRLYNRSDVRGEDREELAGILDYFMIEHGIEG